MKEQHLCQDHPTLYVGRGEYTPSELEDINFIQEGLLRPNPKNIPAAGKRRRRGELTACFHQKL